MRSSMRSSHYGPKCVYEEIKWTAYSNKNLWARKTHTLSGEQENIEFIVFSF